MFLRASMVVGLLMIFINETISVIVHTISLIKIFSLPCKIILENKVKCLLTHSTTEFKNLLE